MFRGNAARSGASSFAGPDRPAVHWKVDEVVDSSSEEPAVAADGSVYVRNYHELLAISSSGRIRWRRPVDAGGGTPAIGPDGTIYAISSKLAHTPFRASLLAFLPDGRRKWRLGFQRETGSAQGPIVGNNGDIYVSDNHRLYAVTPRGVRRWTWEPRAPVEGLGLYGPAQGPDGTLYVSAAGVLCAVKPTGTAVWCRKVTAGAALPVVSPTDGHIYVSYGRRIVALDRGGRHLWGRSVSLSSIPAVDEEGTVVVVSGQGAVISYTPDGRVRWARFRGVRMERPTGTPPGAVIDSDGNVFVGARFGLPLAALDGDSGRVLWESRVHRGQSVPTTGPPVIGGDGRAYVQVGAALYALGR